MSKTELVPCPFCGSELELLKEHYWCHPTDKKCILNHLCFETDDLEGIDLWNTRKPMEKIVERLEALFDEAQDNMSEDFVYYDGYGDGVDRAIRIVEGEGGLSE